MYSEYCIISRVYLFKKPFRCLLGASRDNLTNIFRISPSQLLNPLNVSKAFFGFEQELLTLRGFTGEVQKVCVPSTTSGSVIVPTLSLEDAIVVIKVLAERGHSVAQKMVSNQVSLPYNVNIESKQSNVGKSTTRERDVQRDLVASLGGQIEVSTPDGAIDLLTDTEIIEIKALESWKSALGQILIYSEHYPLHFKRIHLFHSNPCYLIKPHESKRAKLVYEKWGIRFSADWMV